jgi:hypothetical protein
MRGVAGAKRVWGQRVWVKGMLACTPPPPSLRLLGDGKALEIKYDGDLAA